MKVHVRRVGDGFRMIGTNEAGNTIIMEPSSQQSEAGDGVSPMQLVIMALAGCSGIDIIEILAKGRQQLDSFEAEIDARRAQGQPAAVFTHIHLTYRLTGALQPAKVRRAIDLSLAKYCSVAKMLEKTAEISYSFSINGAQHVVE
jgi:putative redox protein